MKLGKLVAKGVAQDVLDVAAPEPRPEQREHETTEAETALPVTVEPATAGSSTQR